MIRGSITNPTEDEILKGKLPGNVNYGIQGPSGPKGSEGGYYIPAVKQMDENTIQFTFESSKTDMPVVDPTTVLLPAGSGIDVSGAAPGQTVKIAAVDDKGRPTAWVPADFPDSGGNVDLTGYATEQYVQEYAQPKGEYLTAIPEGYAKTEDIPTKPEDIGAQPSGNYLTEVPSGYATEEFVKNKIAEAALEGNDVDLSGYAQKSELPTKVSQLQNDSGYLTEHQDISGKLDASALPTAINTALAQAKASGEFDGKDGVDGKDGQDGYTPQKNVDYFDGQPGKDGIDGKDGSDANVTAQNIASALGYTPANESTVNSLSSNQSALSTRMDAFTALGEGSTTGDAELIDARVDCDGKVWDNAGGHIRGITEKIIDACCDKEIVSGGNYNLFKISEVTFSSRLQDDVEGMVSSNENNAVTGWIPVKYGKYYSTSAIENGTKRGFSYQRANLKLSDGTIIVYNKSQVPTTGVASHKIIDIVHENAIEIMLHFAVVNASDQMQDISTADKLRAFKPMFVEGNTPDEAYQNAMNLEYLDGDVEVPGEVNYTLKHDSTKVNKVSLSPYYRNVNFGVMPFAYYQGLSDSYVSAGFTKNTKYANFIATWKALVANHSGYVTETELGKASDGQSIYLYDFKPVRITNQNKPIPKVIVVAGQHGFEKSNVFGLYHFVGNLLNKWTQHPALEYLRNNVELMVVPVLNTYGFDNLQYKNANGVNTNRNYDSNWSLVGDTTSSDYGGAEPFDQPETQIVRNLMMTNADALLVIDFHTNGGTSVTKYEDVNWCAVCSNTDSYYNRMLDAVAHHLSAITGRFNLDYALNQPNVMLGHMTVNDGAGLLRNWTTDNDFIGVLVEGFNGFPNGTEFSADVYKANEEIIANYLITALNYLAR